MSDKPVAIFLPQHKPRRARQLVGPVIAAALGVGVGIALAAYGLGGATGAVVPAEETAAAEVADGPAVVANGPIVHDAAVAQPAKADEPEAAPEPAARLSVAETVAVAPAAQADDPLEANDPRWAKEPPASPTATRAAAALAAAAAPGGLTAKPAGAQAKALLSYGEQTAGAKEERAPVASDEAVAPMLGEEAGRSGDVDADGAIRTAAVAPSEETQTVATEAVEEPAAAAPTRSARVSTAVNLRSRADNKSSVLGVVPGGAMVDVIDCEAWCKIVYGGRTGYVYKGFVGGGSRKSSAARTPAKPAANDPAPKQASAEAPREDAKPLSKSVTTDNRGR